MRYALALVAALAGTAHADRSYLEPELGGALVDFDHEDCAGCSKAGSFSGGAIGLGARYEAYAPVGVSIRARFDLTTSGRQYYVGIGGYWQFLPQVYAELTIGRGSAGQYDEVDIVSTGYMASLRFSRELAPWLSAAVQASTFVHRTDTNANDPMRSYEASVTLVLPIPLQ